MKYTLIFSATVVSQEKYRGWGEGWRSQGLDFPLNKGFVSQLRGGISDNLNHKKSAKNVFTIRLRTTTNFPNCLSNNNLMVILIIMVMHLGIMCMGMVMMRPISYFISKILATAAKRKKFGQMSSQYSQQPLQQQRTKTGNMLEEYLTWFVHLEILPECSKLVKSGKITNYMCGLSFCTSHA